MGKQAKDIEYPRIPLAHASVDSYCQSIQHSRFNGFWWYLFPSRWMGNISQPFCVDGLWHFCIRPGFAWPADWRSPAVSSLPYSKSWLGRQYPSPSERANSRFVYRGIETLSEYSHTRLDSKRRTIIRRGLRDCSIEALHNFDTATRKECYEIWNEHAERTNWKTALTEDFFVDSWKELLDCPGVTILLGRDKESGRCLGWQIAKLFGDGAYGDAIASRSDRSGANVNDALIYTFIMNAQQHEKAEWFYFGLRSDIEPIERFKESIGLKLCSYPSRIEMNPLIRTGLQTFAPATWRRLCGSAENGHED